MQLIGIFGIFVAMKTPERILVIKLRAIGDVVMATPVLENLRQAFPDATIDFLTEKTCAPVVKRHPAINQVIEFDRVYLQVLSPRRRLAVTLGELWKLRRQRYDLVFDLFGNPRTAIMARVTGAPRRVGFAFRGRRYAYNLVVTPRGHLAHEVEFNLDALRALNIPIVSRQPSVHIDELSDATADAFWTANDLSERTVIGLNPSGGWYTKRWPPHRFAALGNLIVEKLGAVPLLLWGPGERAEAQCIVDGMQHAALLAPHSTLPLLAGMLRRMTVLVSNDSGPLHIAAAVGTRVVGIYGPTRPELQGPWGQGHEIVRQEGLDCLGCNGTTCRIESHACMQELAVATVFESLQRCLNNAPARPANQTNQAALHRQ